MSKPVCHHVNLQMGFGGGEVYTAFLLRAMLELGWQVRLYINAHNPHWAQRLPLGVELVPLPGIESLAEALPTTPSLVFFQTPQPGAVIETLHQRGHRCCVFVHMPLYGRDPTPLQAFDHVVAVSRYVIASLHDAGITRVHPTPLLGVADLDRPYDRQHDLRSGPLYDWDRRKVRDRLGRLLTPFVAPFLPSRRFEKRPGLTLGIVSRLTPIKQFPQLFSLLSPILAAEPDISLEIFGSGGYASVRDLRQALRPLGNRCRFWGHQENVRSVYAQLDALLTGLPEKEALGLNIIEAAACGIPVLAIDAPPFDETVAEGICGWRYRDPREDGGADFHRVLQKLRTGLQVPDAVRKAHLAQFSFASFVDRVAGLMNTLTQPAE